MGTVPFDTVSIPPIQSVSMNSTGFQALSMSSRVWALIGIGAFVVALCVPEPSVAQRATPPQVAGNAAGEAVDKAKLKRIREGTPFARRLASFQIVGPRIAIRFEGKGDSTAEPERFLCLENLQLERISQAIQDRSTQLYWWIDGTFTEYRGSNYVLVQRIQQAPQSALEALRGETNTVAPSTPTKVP